MPLLKDNIIGSVKAGGSEYFTALKQQIYNALSLIYSYKGKFRFQYGNLSDLKVYEFD